MTDQINEDFKNNLISKIPSGKLGNGDDVSNCVAFLASDMADYITWGNQYMLMVECICLDNSY